ncbi:outer membrane beta-barrel protein, partial [Mucilaginibacter sp.]
QASEAPVLAQQTPAQPIAHQHNWLNGMGTPTTQPGKSPVVPTSVSTGEAYTQQPASTPLAAKAVKTDPANGPDSAKTTPAMAAQQQIAQNSSAVQSNTSAATQKATDNGANAKVSAHMMDMLEQDKAARQAKSNTETSQADKKVTFSIYAATYFNYAEGSSNQVNAGAGVSSDFRLSKRLKLSTGVALAQNSLNYNAITSLPQTVSAASFVSSAPVLKQQTLFAMSAAAPVFRNYNVSMVGLDVPINLKYEFNPDKSDAFISAGLSSGTFIDENYTYRYTYSNGSLADSQGAGEDQKQSAHNSFSNFYFARMLNFSFGVGYPVGKNRLVIEPFVKYPLGGLGAQDIRFGSGGVNLKFSFKSSKK